MSGESFEDMAKQFSEPARTEEARPGDAPAGEEKLVVSVEVAQGALEYCFWPLAKLDHPGWALSEEQSLKGAPTMQAFLQAVADRIAPQILARLVNKYPAFMDLLGMLAAMGYVKYREVKRLKALESKQPVPIRADAAPTPVTENEGVTCEECGKVFSTAQDAFAHLPCPGRSVQ